MRHHMLAALLFTTIAPWAIPAAGQEDDRDRRPARVESAGLPPSSATGILKRNSGDRDGSAPYVLVDRWGAVQSYVTPGPGMELEPYLGRQVTLQGGLKAIPGSEGSCLKAAKVTPGNRAPRNEPPPSEPPRTARRTTRNGAVRSTAYQDAEGPSEKAGAAGLAPLPAETGRSGRRMADPGEMVEEIPPGEIQQRGRPVAGPGPGPDYGPDCGPSCPPYGPCNEGCPPCGPCFNPLGGLWVRADYLMWWTRGMSVPPLVTQGTPAVPTANVTPQPGYLDVDDPPTTILFGGERIMDRMRSGGRLQAGMWLDACHTIGVEGEYFALDTAAEHFRVWSDGYPPISRPFYDVTPTETDPNQPRNIQNVQKVAFPRPFANSLDGSVSVDALTRLQSASALGRLNLWCVERCGSGCRTDLIFGYRFLRLDDRIGVHEELTSTDPTAGGEVESPQGLGAFVVDDQFSSQNQFHGGELGLVYQRHLGRFSFEVAPKIAFGNTRQIVDIQGSTRITNFDGVRSDHAGGLLAQQQTNIGRHSQDTFSVVPEIGLTIGYQVTCRLRATMGYNFLYWSRVARAGDQIDDHVNSDFIPPGATGLPTQQDLTNPALRHPAFAFREAGFWAQGLTFGAEYRW